MDGRRLPSLKSLREATTNATNLVEEDMTGRLGRAALTVALVMLAHDAALAQGGPLPWGQSSDMVAWETFVQITAPSGNPQTTNVEFETWASDQDIYRTSPPRWPLPGAPKQLLVSALGNIRLRHGPLPFVIAPSQCTQSYDPAAAKAAGFPSDGCIGEEVRRNWASFQYIVSNQLYSVAGLKAAFAKGLKVDLPADAIELKGDWIRVTDAMKWYNIDAQKVHELFYTNTATDGATTAEFALVSFHFSTKQIKNWVWSDFEHQMTPGRCDDIGCHDSFGATVPDVPARTPPNQSYGECQKTPALEAMLANAGISSVWKNYCLKGSQITFTQADGKPTLLGNSVIERINAGVPVLQSSCITCHAYASFDSTGSTGGPPTPDQIGNVDPSKLQGLMTNDFIWGNLFAQ
jgi:hypothetical protein